MYFFLKPQILLVKGAHNGAIYDLEHGKLFSISQTVKEILSYSENGTPVKRLGKPIHLVERFLHRLEKMQLGYFTDQREPPDKLQFAPPTPKLLMMWLSLNSNCNLLCEHCYATSEPGPSDNTVSLEHIFRAIIEAREIFDLECVQLIGGEPLLLGKKKVTAIIGFAHRIGIPYIEVFTNGILIDDYYIQLFKDKEVHVAISIYSQEPSEHDKVTNSIGSWEKTVNSIRAVREAEIPVRLGIVATSTNRKSVDNIANWIEDEFGILLGGKPYDVVRTCGRGSNTDIIPWELFLKQHMRLKPDFQPINFHSVQQAMYGNVCWANEVCILPNGDVTPCEMETETIQGNIVTQTLTDIVLGPGGELTQRLTKDKIATCRDCEYRYACWECRAMANQLDNNKYCKPLTCMYNPYSGVWESPPHHLFDRFPKLQHEFL